jgi:hypothetical protein
VALHEHPLTSAFQELTGAREWGSRPFSLATCCSLTRSAWGLTLASRSKNFETRHVGEVLGPRSSFLVRDEFSKTDDRKSSRLKAGVHTPFPHTREVDSVDSGQDIDAPWLASEHPDSSGSSQVSGGRHQGAKPEFDERGAQSSRVRDAWSDEYVEILGEPGFTVRCDGVPSDEHESHAMRDQKTQELGPISTEFDLHRTRPFSAA